MRPITAQTGYTAADLDTLLAGNQFVFVDCYTILMADGTTKLYYSTGQRDVTVLPTDGGLSRITYKAKKVLIQGLRFKIGVGVEVDEQTITMGYQDTDTVNGFPISYALKIGWFDGATIARDRFFATDWGSPWIGGIPMFKGRVSTLDTVGRVEAKLKVKSSLVLLNINMPRLIWQPTCTNTLFDPNCGVNPAGFSTNVTLASDGTPTVLPWSGASSDYTLGKVTIDNGDGVLRVRSIKSIQAGSSVTLVYPLDFTPIAGTVFTAYQGCERTLARCPHFGGNYLDRNRSYPFVPTSETAV